MKLATSDLANGPLIDPKSVLAYLGTGAWTELDEHRLDGRHVITLFEHQVHDVEVHVPVWPEARDYAPMLAEAINKIAAAERRASLALLNDLRAARSDVLRLETGDRPLTLSAALAVLSAARELCAMAATARGYRAVAADEPLPSAVDALLDRLALELPEPGVAGVRVLVPVSAEPAAVAEPVSRAAEPGPPPLGRRLTETLATMITAARQAADVAAIGGGLEPFLDRGVSARLCRALSSVGRPFTIVIGWALTSPRAPVEPVTFSAGQLAVLADAAARLPVSRPPA